MVALSIAQKTLKCKPANPFRRQSVEWNGRYWFTELTIYVMRT
jgi:hypothetical protein